MFYAHAQQSPGIAHKLAPHAGQMHDQSAWSRNGPHVLGPPGHAQPPGSSGYPLFTHANGGMTALQHLPHPHMTGPMSHHQHHNSLSHSHPHYQSPPNGNGIPGAHAGLVPNGSPANGAVTQIMTPHWQNQLMKCEMIRASRSPHHRARASAMASRTVQKAAIPIQNPNAVKVPETNGAAKEGETNGTPSSASSNAVTNGSPSSTAATSVTVAERPRPPAPKPPENNWTSLDMGGVNIKNLPPTSGLFSFTFLINLYLNHNALSSIPPEITRLRHLELLDLSGNSLVTVPPELGMLTSLKELYLFDNHISTLPPELGTLHQLQTLGIEGNPIDPTLKHMVQEQGTPALIAHLRDTCPAPTPPPARLWRNLISQTERENMLTDPNVETFKVLCYNVLCERCATERVYGYTPSWALQWKYRKDLILDEVKSHDCDFVCLQEVDIAQYEEFFLANLSDHGYDGVYWPKSRYKTMSEADRRMVDGCAIFYKSSKYTLVEKHLVEFSTVAMQRADLKKTDDMFNRVLTKDHIAIISLFENKETGTRFIVANAHIHWDPQFRDVKLVQVALLMDEVEKVANNFAKYPPRPPAPISSTDANGSTIENNASSRPPPTYSDGAKIPTIICGDYNSVPDSGVYEFLSTGSLPADHPDWMSFTYGKYTQDGLRHRFGLKSAYGALGELPMTNYTPTFREPIDYIWYSTSSLAVNAVLGEVDKSYLDKVVGFPNAHFPSDHLAIVSEFRVKPPKEAQPARPPPVFPESSR